MTTLKALTLAVLALGMGAAIAHGKDEHPAARPFDASRVEPTAFGQEGDPRKVSRTVQVDMTDAMRFTPSSVTVQRGDTVKFVVHNGGRLLHEMVLGTREAIAEHAEQMKKFPDMEHADANMAHVKPGKSGEIVWHFTRPGEFSFACLQPGHFEAGMVGKVVVTGASPVGHAANHSTAAAAAESGPLSEGEVRRIDRDQGKVTLRHGPLKNLDMAAMTMVFRVADPKLLDGLKEGDKVRFAADRIHGAFTVTAIQPAP
jgi:uncharacterized cupredoxin-like copper-binding protein